MMSIFGANKQDQEIKRLEGLEQEYQTAYKNTVLCGLQSKAVSFVLLVAFFSFFMYRSYTLISTKQIKTAAFVSLFMMFTSIISSMFWLVDIIRDIVLEWGTILDTEKLLEEPPKKVSASTSLMKSTPASSTPGIGFHHVRFRYPNADRMLLKDVHVHINKGDRVALLGENGSGKSTMLKMILQFHNPESGGLYMDGQWYENKTSMDIRRRIGYISQHAVLFNRTIMENIRYGNEHISEDEVILIVTQLGLMQEFKNFKEGIYSNAGKHGSHLSGGQRQLIWTLRVLLRNPDYIVMDEPTASLDDETKRLLKNMLDILAKDKTIIVVSHDPFMISQMKRHITLKEGVIVTDTGDAVTNGRSTGAAADQKKKEEYTKSPSKLENKSSGMYYNDLYAW